MNWQSNMNKIKLLLKSCNVTKNYRFDRSVDINIAKPNVEIDE